MNGRVLAVTISTVASIMLTMMIETDSASARRKRLKKDLTKSNATIPDPSSWVPSQDAEVAPNRPGWRRAKQGEVTPEMTSAAISALSRPLGTWAVMGNYAIALETHYNDVKGEHKGASVFVRT